MNLKAKIIYENVWTKGSMDITKTPPLGYKTHTRLMLSKYTYHNTTGRVVHGLSGHNQDSAHGVKTHMRHTVVLYASYLPREIPTGKYVFRGIPLVGIVGGIGHPVASREDL